MKKKTKVYVGMDVHKDSAVIAVLPEGVRETDGGQAAVARSAGDQAVAGPPGPGARRARMLRSERCGLRAGAQDPELGGAGVPVVYSKSGERNEDLAKGYLPGDPGYEGVFVVIVRRAPSNVWDVEHTTDGRIRRIGGKVPRPWVMERVSIKAIATPVLDIAPAAAALPRVSAGKIAAAVVHPHLTSDTGGTTALSADHLCPAERDRGNKRADNDQLYHG